ncbi:hypothetical protein FD755_017229, partial [Muntiacus reevesi]
GGLDEEVSKPLLWELFLQARPVVNIHMPRDRVTGQHQDADSAIKMNMIKLYGKPIQVNKASAHNKNLDVGTNIFIGNLDPKIHEKLLYDNLSACGFTLPTPKIMWDPDIRNSKGYAFITMNGQYLYNLPITVEGHKKDSKGECHEPLSQADHPHQLFANVPPPPSAPKPVVSSLGSGLPPPLPSPGAFHLGYPQLCPHHLCLPGAGGHGLPSAGIPGAGQPGHRHLHPHPFPLGGIPHGLGQPHAGPPGSGRQPPPQPPPGMPHSGHLPMSMPQPQQGPLFGS